MDLLGSQKSPIEYQAFELLKVKILLFAHY
ncbi:hypothetical protein CLU82_3385 [Flavobacterium sp. 5]|nr:hypothetical protein CLU82_3385 [Flavobacterium sp. 5]